MNLRTKAAFLAVGMIAVAALLVAVTSTGTLGGPSQTTRQNIRGIAVDYAGSRAALDVDQFGTGQVANLTVDRGTPVAVIDNAGDLELRSDFRLGNGTPSVTQNGEDAYIEGQLEVDGEAQFDGAIDANGAADFASTVAIAGDVTLSGTDTDVTLSETTDGGNAGAVNQFIGLPRLGAFAIGAMTDGSETVTGYIDETPAGEWTGTTNVTDSTESAIYRKGTAALELNFTSAVTTGNGADNTLSGGDEDWTDDESVGMWLRCDTTLSAGDLVLEITDSGAGATTVEFPALTTADHWTWVELNIGGVANASKDVIESIGLDVSAAGAVALASQTCYFDYMFKWDAAEEEALGLDVLEDGVLSVFGITTAQDQVNTPALLVEGTDYFIHYETGNDFFVAITDQSAKSGWGIAALE